MSSAPTINSIRSDIDVFITTRLPGDAMMDDIARVKECNAFVAKLEELKNMLIDATLSGGLAIVENTTTAQPARDRLSAVLGFPIGQPVSPKAKAEPIAEAEAEAEAKVKPMRWADAVNDDHEGKHDDVNPINVQQLTSFNLHELGNIEGMPALASIDEIHVSDYHWRIVYIRSIECLVLIIDPTNYHVMGHIEYQHDHLDIVSSEICGANGSHCSGQTCRRYHNPINSNTATAPMKIGAKQADHTYEHMGSSAKNVRAVSNWSSVSEKIRMCNATFALSGDMMIRAAKLSNLVKENQCLEMSQYVEHASTRADRRHTRREYHKSQHKKDSDGYTQVHNKGNSSKK
jgi:hypothetical protein